MNKTKKEVMLHLNLPESELQSQELEGSSPQKVKINNKII